MFGERSGARSGGRRALTLSLLLALVFSLLQVVAFAQVPGIQELDIPNPSDAQIEDARRRVQDIDGALDRARRDVQSAAAEVAELEAELTQANAELEQATALYNQSNANAQTARADADRATKRMIGSQAELDTNQTKLHSYARDAYKYGPGSATPAMAALKTLSSNNDDPNAVSDTLHMLGIVLGDSADVVDESRRLTEQTAIFAEQARVARGIAESELDTASVARDRAAELHAEVNTLVDQTSLALERQREVVAEHEAQLAGASSEVATLQNQRATAEKALADKIAREKAEAERIAREKAAAEKAAAEKAEAERLAEIAAAEAATAKQKAAAKAAAEKASSAAKSAASSKSSAASSAAASVSISGSGSFVSVDGIRVSSAIASNLASLLEAARADGIALGGSGYRSSDVTAWLRIANGCPDVYSSPASSCRVPTARPGSSMHEQGLAIDFTYQGRTICFPLRASSCRGNAAFNWLSANASSFGFYGLSSEAWHWSTTGD